MGLFLRTEAGMSDSVASLRHQIASAQELESVVRTMKAMASSAIGQYESAVRSLDDYYRTVQLGLAACLSNNQSTVLARHHADNSGTYQSDQKNSNDKNKKDKDKDKKEDENKEKNKRANKGDKKIPKKKLPALLKQLIQDDNQLQKKVIDAETVERKGRERKREEERKSILSL